MTRHERIFEPSSKASLQLDLIQSIERVKRQEAAFRKLAARSMTDLDTGCVKWCGCTDPTRYDNAPKVYFEGKVQNMTTVSWIAHYGENPPEGKQVQHKCDDPRCWNKDCLKLGTPKDNIEDMDSRGRRKGRLKNKAVLKIVELYEKTKIGIKELSEMFDRSVAAIIKILIGKAHARLTKIVFKPAKPHQRKLRMETVYA